VNDWIAKRTAGVPMNMDWISNPVPRLTAMVSSDSAQCYEIIEPLFRVDSKVSKPMGPSNSQSITAKNHFVPQLYLKRWAGVDSKIGRYSLLVPNENVHPWKKSSTGAIGYHQHLYTRIVGGVAEDEVETWLNQDFETPAVLPLSRAVGEQALTSGDWSAILRFMWIQGARTPASFLKFRERQIQHLPAIMQKSLTDSVQKWEETKSTGKAIAHQTSRATKDFPSKVTKAIEPGAETGTLKVEVDVGRGLWLWSLRQDYAATMAALHLLKTTILRPPAGLNWLTSDDPVVKVNYYSPKEYDFGGGYGHAGTEILFPLSPQHLLYAKVGARPAFEKYQRVPESIAAVFQKLLIEHAHRMIFAVAPDPMVEKFHPRHVSMAHYNYEAAQWEQWHQEQSAAEAAIVKP
jgi:Protein of unknown function (DUF4238)